MRTGIAVQARARVGSCGKLGVTSHTQAIARAREIGVLYISTGRREA